MNEEYDIEVELDATALVDALISSPAALAKLAEAVRIAQTKQARRFGNSGGNNTGLFGNWGGRS